jgi:tRNA(Arg) A34 adenosine deaminase TadA
MAQALIQPKNPGSAAFMARALAHAAHATASGDGQGYGAVIVRAGAVIGEGWNRIYANHDPTAHGEIEAIRDASRRIGSRDLSGAVIYTTGGHPCPMCATACYWAGLERIYFGSDPDTISDAGAPAYGKC